VGLYRAVAQKGFGYHENMGACLVYGIVLFKPMKRSLLKTGSMRLNSDASLGVPNHSQATQAASDCETNLKAPVDSKGPNQRDGAKNDSTAQSVARFNQMVRCILVWLKIDVRPKLVFMEAPGPLVHPVT
jgi:hypothetical protein